MRKLLIRRAISAYEKAMQQNNSPHFFSRPLIYFGTHPYLEEDMEEEEESQELDLDTGIFLEPDLIFPFEQKAGIFFFWSEHINECSAFPERTSSSFFLD